MTPEQMQAAYAAVNARRPLMIGGEQYVHVEAFEQAVHTAYDGGGMFALDLIDAAPLRSRLRVRRLTRLLRQAIEASRS